MRSPLLVRSVLALAWCACAKAPAASPGPSSAPYSVPMAPIAVPYTQRNEVLTADVSVLGVKAATIRLELRSPACAPSDRKGVVTMSSTSKATGIAAFLVRAQVDIATTVDPATGHPIDDSSHFSLDSKPRDYQVRFERGRYAYDYRRSDGLALAETVDIPEHAWPHDLHSGALLLRSWKATSGDQAHLFGVLGRHLWRVDVTFQGPDILMRGDGARPTVRIDGVAEKLTGDERGTARKFQVWLTDDAERLPLVATVETSWGDAILELERYERASADECGMFASPSSASSPPGASAAPPHSAVVPSTTSSAPSAAPHRRFP